MKKIIVIGFHYQKDSLDKRERWALPKEMHLEFLKALKKIDNLSEAFYLSTCNRAEVYAVVDENFDSQKIVVLWARFSSAKNEEGPSLFLEQREAIYHLFRVAASLDSMVVGETQVLSQLKQAYQLALEEKATGPWLNRLFQQSFAEAKKVRTSTGIGKEPVSVSSIAVSLTEKIFGDLSSVSALVIGLGEVGRETAQRMDERGLGKIHVTNRTDSKADKLASQLSVGQMVSFDDWKNLLCDVDVVITSTSSPTPIVTNSLFEKKEFCRRSRPLFLIDLGLPRDIESSIGALDQTYLYNLDDLQAIAEMNRSKRQKEAQKADASLQGSASQIFQRLSYLEN